MEALITKQDLSVDERFQKLLANGEPPFDYEKRLLKEYRGLVLAIINGQNPPPYELEIQTSPFCNAGCSHCWAKKFTRLPDLLSEKENADRIIKQVLGFERGGFKIDNIKFCGSTGEPLMNPLTLYMIDRFSGAKDTKLFTNGIAIAEGLENNEYIGTLGKLDRMNLSLDAGTTETLWKIKPISGKKGVRLERILQGIRKIREKNPKQSIEVSYVITNANYKEVIEATKKAKAAGASLIRFRIDMVDRNVSLYHGVEILELLKGAKIYQDSGFGVNMIHSEDEIGGTNQEDFSTRGCMSKCYTSQLWSCIGSDGCLYPCGHIVDRTTENYGNLLEKTFEEIWDGEDRKKIIKELPAEKCSICSPSSLRRNILMTFLSELPREKATGLVMRV